MPRGRPKVVKENLGIEIPEIPSIRPKPQIIDPNFGHSRPAPKPTKKVKGKPQSEE